jgi:hypothetical protein
MSRTKGLTARPILLGVLAVLTIGSLTCTAGERSFRRARRPAVVRPVPAARRIDPVYGDRLGTFYPTPAIIVQSGYPATTGYAPLGIFGDHNLSVFGPFSSFRTMTAPVATYVRGYDGVVRPAEAISTSYPNLPLLSPVAYPTRANNYYAPRIRDNPAWESAIDWLDMN